MEILRERLMGEKPSDTSHVVDPKNLIEGLDRLNSDLAAKGEHIELVVIGSMAIELNGYTLNRKTRDIDVANNIDLAPYQDEINRIQKKLALPDTEWINIRANTIEPWPKGMKERLVTINGHSNIDLKVASVKDLKSFKISALYTRNAQRDLEDLYILEVNKEDIDRGIEYIKDIILHNHGEDQLAKDINEIEDFKKALYERFC